MCSYKVSVIPSLYFEKTRELHPLRFRLSYIMPMNVTASACLRPHLSKADPFLAEHASIYTTETSLYEIPVRRNELPFPSLKKELIFLLSPPNTSSNSRTDYFKEFTFTYEL